MSDPNAQTKQRQRWLIVLAASVILILFIAGLFFFDSSPQKRTEHPKTVPITTPGTLEDRDAWRAHEAAREKNNEAQIQALRSQVKTQTEKGRQLDKALAALKARQANSPMALEPPSVHAPNAAQLGEALTLLNEPLNQKPLPPPQHELEIIVFNEPESSAIAGIEGEGQKQEGVSLNTQEKPYRSSSSSENRRQPIEFIPAGSFVRVAMLNGVDAPTGGQAQSNPLPVAFHVLDTANLANRHRLDIRDCRFIAAAWGDLSSERMMGRTETLTCLINGETVEMPVKGHVIGEDGKAGVRGRLVTKQGQLLANALFSGALGGIGSAFQQAATITTVGGGGLTHTVDPKKMWQAAAGGGAGNAANMLAQYYLKAADNLYPVIETDGGRVVEILITKGAVYQGSPKMQEEYRGLLRRNGLRVRRGAGE